MAKLKLKQINKIFCPTCKGNGFIKVGTDWGETVHQCWDCDSEGEFYETTDNTIGDDDSGYTIIDEWLH